MAGYFPDLLRRKKGPGIIDPDAVPIPPAAGKVPVGQVAPVTSPDTGTTGTATGFLPNGALNTAVSATAGNTGLALQEQYLASQKGLINEAERTSGLRQQTIQGGGRSGSRTITTGSAPSRQDFQFAKTGTNANPSVTFQSPAEKMAEMQAQQDRIGSLQRGAVQTANRAQSTAAGANRVATIRGTEARYGGGSRGVVNYLPTSTPERIADERGVLQRTATGFAPNIPRRPAGVSPAIAHNDIMGRSAAPTVMINPATPAPRPIRQTAAPAAGQRIAGLFNPKRPVRRW